MARTAIVFGLLLCGLTLYGLFASMLKSPLQFVPLMFGIPVFLCGIVGLNPHRQRLASFIAAIISPCDWKGWTRPGLAPRTEVEW